MKYSIVTFGCRVNQADSLGFEECLRAEGATAAAAADADLVIVNTCSVTASADQGARQTIRRVARDNPLATIVVTGCYASRRPDELAALPNVARVISNDDKPQLVRLIGTIPRAALSTFRTGGVDYSRSRRRGSVRQNDRAGRGRPNGVHAAGSDRLRGAVFVLHYPDDARRSAERADRRCAARSRAGRGRRFQGDRIDRRASRLLRP